MEQATNGGLINRAIQLLLPAILAIVGSYVAVTSRLSAVEVRIEERTTALRQQIATLERRHDREVEVLQRADEVSARVAADALASAKRR